MTEVEPLSDEDVNEACIRMLFEVTEEGRQHSRAVTQFVLANDGRRLQLLVARVDAEGMSASLMKTADGPWPIVELEDLPESLATFREAIEEATTAAAASRGAIPLPDVCASRKIVLPDGDVYALQAAWLTDLDS